MPLLNKDFQYIKWTSPTELVQAYPNQTKCDQVKITQGKVVNADQRGGSQLVNWGEYYIAITHEVVLAKNYLKQKNGQYRHRLCVWDKDLNLIGISPESFSFLDAQIEFVCGAAVLDNKLLISWGFQDNSAYVLEVPTDVVDALITEALNV